MNRSLWFTAPRRVELRDDAEPRRVGATEVRARGLVSGVSQGTELLLYRGEGPTPFDPSLDPAGAPTYPRRYGYAWVGEVEDAGERAEVPIGARVFALAPHGDVHVLDAAAVRRLPADVPSARGVLAANVETALTATWDAGIGIGDRVVVLGGGVVGLLCAWLAPRAGAHAVHVVEPSERRRDAARAIGATSACAPSDDDDAPRGDADVVLEATGDPASLDRAIAHAGREGVVAIASFYGARASAVRLGDAFHRRRLRLVSTQVSTIPPLRAPRWTHARRFAAVCELLADATLDVLAEPSVPFAEAPATYARLDAKPGESLQICFRYRESG